MSLHIGVEDNVVSVLLVAPPGAMREALIAGLRLTGGIELVRTVGGSLSAVQAIAELKPETVVVSGQFSPDEIAALVDAHRDGRDAVRIVVLASSPAQERQMLSAGAAAVVNAWDPIDVLYRAIRGLPADSGSAINQPVT